MNYWKNLLIAVDQLVNALIGGWPDETLSSRCYRWARDGVRAWPRKLVDGLFFWQREHCKSSYESEREGRQSPPELTVMLTATLSITHGRSNRKDFRNSSGDSLRTGQAAVFPTVKNPPILIRAT